ncbi:MAG: nitrite/sulfite reductase [Anaerolineales bacterium]
MNGQPELSANDLAGHTLDPVAAAEIDRFTHLIEQRRLGQVEEEAFRRFRLQYGVYGIRGQEDVQMVRVKVPYGALAGAQLECLRNIAEHFARGVGHITTRQDLQFYWVPLEAVPQVLRRLAEVGLTTREASGNIVRNVTACPLAGVCADEAFDVTPYADAMSRYLLRNPVCQALPRKFKIAFSGCGTDCAVAGIHDIGAVATVREEGGVSLRGFRLYVGGGLGPSPRAAHLLEPFTPAEDLILTATAVIRVFDRLGNRQNRARARMKFLIEELGGEEFDRLVFQERELLWATWAGGPPSSPAIGDPSPPAAVGPSAPGEAPPPGFDSWRATNVVGQRQPGYCAAFVTVPGGDLSADQFRILAALVRRFPGVELRAVITQNLVLRWVPEKRLPELYASLAEAELGKPGVHGIGNVLGCPGADTCNLALTHSHRLALELGRQLEERDDLALAEDLRGVSIKISGCPNSCGHHHIATIGLHGAVRRVEGRQVPYYQLMLGGEAGDGEVTFGRPVMRIPARRVPEAIFRLVALFRAEREEGESFASWIKRKETSGADRDQTIGEETRKA